MQTPEIGRKVEEQKPKLIDREFLMQFPSLCNLQIRLARARTRMRVEKGVALIYPQKERLQRS